MPLGFWNDRGDERYHAAYFAKYPNVWCHGDWCELTEITARSRRHTGTTVQGASVMKCWND